MMNDKRSHFTTPVEGPVTDLPHPELFAAEPSTGRHVVVIHPPLLPCDARDARNKMFFSGVGCGVVIRQLTDNTSMMTLCERLREHLGWHLRCRSPTRMRVASHPPLRNSTTVVTKRVSPLKHHTTITRTSYQCSLAAYVVPFLPPLTSHAARPATSARHPTSLSLASSTHSPEGPLERFD